jgi:hypothetical protein
VATGKTLNRIYHDKNKVRVAGKGGRLKGFTTKEVAKLAEKSEANKRAKGGAGRGKATPGLK